MGVDLNQMNLSLAGCGYLGSYHLGLCSCMRQFVPQIFRNKISGASVGALVAAAFVCEVPLDKCTVSVFDVSMRVRCGVLGPITPDLNIMQLLYDNMAAILPENAHLYCNGRLFISVTRYDDCKNVLLSQFDSKEDLLQALMCSCFIPLYCGYEPPEFHGVAYVDGGYSDNSPRLDEHTAIVAPFYGDSEICPKDDPGKFRNFMMNNTSIYITLRNCQRLLRILFPGPPEMLKDICQKGFNDGLRFLRDNGIIQCPDCSFRCMEINGNIMNENTNHAKCKPIEYPMPIEISNEIDATVERLTQGLGSRLLKNPVVKVLYYLNMPSIFTVKLSYSLLSKIARKLHNKASSCMVDVSRDLLHYFREIMKHPKFQSNVTCQIDLNQMEYFDEALEEMKLEAIDSVDDVDQQQYETSGPEVAIDLDLKLPHRHRQSSLYLDGDRFSRTKNITSTARETQCQNVQNWELSKMTTSMNGHACRQAVMDMLDNHLLRSEFATRENGDGNEHIDKNMNNTVSLMSTSTHVL